MKIHENTVSCILIFQTWGFFFRERQKLLHYEIDRQCLLHAQ